MRQAFTPALTSWSFSSRSNLSTAGSAARRARASLAVATAVTCECECAHGSAAGSWAPPGRPPRGAIPTVRRGDARHGASTATHLVVAGLEETDSCLPALAVTVHHQNAQSGLTLQGARLRHGIKKWCCAVAPGCQVRAFAAKMPTPQDRIFTRAQAVYIALRV